MDKPTNHSKRAGSSVLSIFDNDDEDDQKTRHKKGDASSKQERVSVGFIDDTGFDGRRTNTSQAWVIPVKETGEGIIESIRNTRRIGNEPAGTKEAKKTEKADGDSMGGESGKSAVVSQAHRERQVYEEQLALLPNEDGVDEYEDKPIDEYGDALLRGMGIFSDSAVVGRNKDKQAPKPVVIKPHAGRMGLGANPDLFDIKRDGSVSVKKDKDRHKDTSKDKDRDRAKEKEKDRERERERERDKDRDRDRDRGKRERERDREAENSSQSHGRNVLVTQGRYLGLNGTCVKSLGDDVFAIRTSDGETIRVEKSHFVYTDGVGLDDSDLMVMMQSLSSSKKSSKHSAETQKDNSWIRNGLRLRVIDKSGANSKFFKQKGVVVDILKPKVCTMKMDSGEIIPEISEKYLESVIPGVGRGVMVVKGKHKGKLGEIIEKSLEKEKAVVKLGDEDASTEEEVIVVSLDDISEWAGLDY